MFLRSSRERPAPARNMLVMNSLEESLAAYLEGQSGLEDLSAAIQQGRSELAAHQSDISSMLAGIPEYLISKERAVWLISFAELDDEFKNIEKDVRDRDLVRSFAEKLELMRETLGLNALSVREAAWAARGPSSHPGINELLYLMEEYSQEQSESVHDYLQSKLEIEFSRFENQAEEYQMLPPFIIEVMEELLPEYRDLLEGLTQISEFEDEDLEAAFVQLEDWGMHYSAFDIDFLSKRYSEVPTTIPTVNFALNCQMLYLEELVNEDMVDHSIELAIEVLHNGSEQFLEERNLSDLDAQSYKEIFEELIAGIESLAEMDTAEELRDGGGEVINLVQRFVAAQSSAEDSSGSRLDFKSESPS